MHDVQSLQFAFLGIVIFLVLAVRLGFSRAGFSGQTVAAIQLVIAVWLGSTGWMATQGYFLNFDALPPRVLFAILPPVAVLIYLGCFKRSFVWVASFPVRWAIGLQTFRIAVELILWRLYVNGLLPREMTFEGRNFDLLIGLTAPFVAFFSTRESVTQKKVRLAWNAFGLVALVNVALHGLLSAPTPLRLLQTQPANTLIAYFPFIWLPAFVVPCAAFFHIVSIRQVLKESALSTPIGSDRDGSFIQNA